MAEKLVKGVVGAVKEGNTTPSGWKPYTVTLVNGTQLPVSLPPDAVASGIKPEPTKEYTFVLGKYDKYMIQSEDAEKTAYPQTTTAPKYTSTSTADKNSYWEDKSNYEVKIRDPKIESQFYFKTVSDYYIAAIPHLNGENKPTTVTELDDYINQAFDKAVALYETVNKK